MLRITLRRKRCGYRKWLGRHRIIERHIVRCRDAALCVIGMLDPDPAQVGFALQLFHRAHQRLFFRVVVCGHRVCLRVGAIDDAGAIPMPHNERVV